MLRTLDIIENFDIEVQGISTFVNDRLVMPDEYGRYIDVDFKRDVVFYLRQDGNTTYSRIGKVACDSYIYEATYTIHAVIVDYHFKYTQSSTLNRLLSAFNDVAIEIVSSETDFNTIKEQEKLRELENAQLTKVVFRFKELTDIECDGLQCNC